MDIKFEQVYEDSWMAIEKDGLTLNDPDMIAKNFLNNFADKDDFRNAYPISNNGSVEIYILPLSNNMMFVTVNLERAKIAKHFVELASQIVEQLGYLQVIFQESCGFNINSKNCDEQVDTYLQMFNMFMDLIAKTGNKMTKELMKKLNTVFSMCFQSVSDKANQNHEKDETAVREFSEEGQKAEKPLVIYTGTIGNIYEAIQKIECHGRILKTNNGYCLETTEKDALNDFLYNVGYSSDFRDAYELELIKEL